MDGNRRMISSARASAARHGFVLSEVLIATMVFVLLSAVLLEVYLMCIRTWHRGSVQVALQRKVATAVQRMVQGHRSAAETRQHGLREAEEIAVLAPQMVEFTSGVDSTKRQFYLNGNEVVYRTDGGDIQTIYDPSRSESPWNTANYKTDLQFTQRQDGTLQIRVVGQERVKSEWVTAFLVTRVAPRNTKKLEETN